MEKHIIYGLNNMSNVVIDIKDFISQSNRRIFAFVGPIGAGKTTLIKKLLKSYGINEEEVISPTFNYVNIYKSDEQRIYHFDLYRLGKAQDFFDMDFDEYLFDPNAIVILEWPEIIFDYIKNKAILFEIEYLNDSSRKLNLKIV